ncbi:MAG: TCR/Tet family MFS transporter [Pseudomonadota bacterium]
MFRNPAVWFILLTVMVDAIGIGLMMPVMPQLLQEINAGSLANAALWGGVMSTTFAAMQFLFGPLVGAISDRYGRRRVLLVSLTVMAIDYVIIGLAGAMWVLILARVLGGITAANHSTAAAVMADISRPHEKAANFGLIGAAFGIGFILGPVIGGFAAEFGSRAPFYVAAVLVGAVAILGYFTLPETLKEENRRDLDAARAQPFGAFASIGKLPGQFRMLVVYFFNEFAFMVYPAVWSFVAIGKFDWEEWLIGVSLGTFGLGMAFSQGYLIRKIIPKIGESNTVILGLSMQGLTLLGFAFAPATWFVFALLPISALGMLGGPAMQGILSRATPDNAQGELQGVISSTRAVAAIVAPMVMTGLYYAATADHLAWKFYGAPFVLSAVLVLTAMLVFIGWRRNADLAPRV